MPFYDILILMRSDINQHLERLDQLTVLLKSDEFLTVRKLASKLGVSDRTLHRDIQLLRQRGIPVMTDRGRGGGVKIHGSWQVGKIQLSDFEVMDILISLAISEKMNSQLFMYDLKFIRYKLLSQLAPKQKIRINLMRKRILIGSAASPTVLTSFEQSTVKPAMQLDSAFLNQMVLEVEYSDGNEQITTRLIEPHYLYLNYPVWYIFSWDHLRLDYRTFRCDRILKISNTESEFKVRPQLEFMHLLQADVPINP